MRGGVERRAYETEGNTCETHIGGHSRLALRVVPGGGRDGHCDWAVVLRSSPTPATRSQLSLDVWLLFALPPGPSAAPFSPELPWQIALAPVPDGTRLLTARSTAESSCLPARSKRGPDRGPGRRTVRGRPKSFAPRRPRPSHEPPSRCREPPRVWGTNFDGRAIRCRRPRG